MLSGIWHFLNLENKVRFGHIFDKYYDTCIMISLSVMAALAKGIVFQCKDFRMKNLET